jgi:hypothetical protein
MVTRIIIVSMLLSIVPLMAQPPTPILTSPPNGETNMSVSNTTVRWAQTPTGIVCNGYNVQLSIYPVFNMILYDINLPSQGLTWQGYSGLSYGTTYYWRVNAYSSVGSSPWSTVWSFTTVPAFPVAPKLLAPGDSAKNVVVTPTLSWYAVANAATYSVQLSTSNTFSTLILNDSNFTTTSRMITSPLSNGTYYWRVRAKNVTGISSWSTVWSFTPVLSIPVAPIISSGKPFVNIVKSDKRFFVSYGGYEKGQLHAELYSVKGELAGVMENTGDGQTLMLPPRSCINGVCVLRIHVPGKTITEKVIVQR